MKQPTRVLVIAAMVMFAILTAGWSQEFDYASYTQTTLQDIEEWNQDDNQSEGQNFQEYIQIECPVFKYQVSCSYSDSKRPISAKRKVLIRMWLEAHKIDSTYLSLYQQEILVSEGAREHWIPMQEQLFPHLDRELVKNDTVSLYIILAGKVESELLFIATEFDKPVSPPGKSIEATASARIVY